MIYKIVIDVEGDAFQIDGNGRGPELARILHALADELAEDAPFSYQANLMDINGNRVGFAKFEG